MKNDMDRTLITMAAMMCGTMLVIVAAVVYVVMSG